MGKSIRGGPLRPLVIGASLLLLLLGYSASRADEPQLVVHLGGGLSESYPVTQIVHVAFEDSTLTVLTTGGPHDYLLGTIARLDFLWDPSSIKDPRSSATLLKAMHLFQNKPNPFSQHTNIEFRLPVPGRVQMQIWSPSGRLVRTLLNADMSSGTHTLRWDGLDEKGRKMPGGVYFYGMTGPGIDEGRQMILLP